MKTAYLYLFFVCVLLCRSLSVNAQSSAAAKYILEQDAQVRKDESGPHDGGGKSIGYSFFDKTSDYPTAFKKRVLKPGSTIGYHLQEKDEVYYIIDGTGEMNMNGETFAVKPGDAILTRPGSSHGLKPTGNKDLVIIIVYSKL